MPPGARPPGLLGLRVPDDAQTTRASADLAASYNLTDDGIRLLSASAREFQLTRGGLRAEAKTPARGASAVSDEQTAPNHHHHPAVVVFVVVVVFSSFSNVFFFSASSRDTTKSVFCHIVYTPTHKKSSSMCGRERQKNEGKTERESTRKKNKKNKKP